MNQGPGKIVDVNGDGIISGADVLASTSVGGWVNPNVSNTQDGDTSHPNDLIGWNFVNNTNNPADDQGHGTFTAGEIAEMTNNGVGARATDWNAQLMPVEFIDSTGNGTDTAAAAAIDYAVNHGAKVINASWGGTGTDPTIAAAIQYADQNGVIIVAAAGNNAANDDTTFFSPASYSAQYANVISVAAIDSKGALASFSNYGTGTVQLAAPGVPSTASRQRQLRLRQRHLDGRAPGDRDGRTGGGRSSHLDDEPGHRRGGQHRHARPRTGGQGDQRRHRERGGRRREHRRPLRGHGDSRRLDEWRRGHLHRAVDLQRGNQPRDVPRVGGHRDRSRGRDQRRDRHRGLRIERPRVRHRVPHPDHRRFLHSDGQPRPPGLVRQ